MRFPGIDSAGKDKVEFLEKCYKLADTSRKRFEVDWFENIGFLVGKHWEAYNNDIQRYRKLPIQPPSANVKVTNNLLLTLVRQATAILKDHISKIEVIPNTSELDDVLAAELGTQFLDWRFYEDDEESKIHKEIIWATVCGRVLRKTYWNPLAGREGMRGVGGEGDISTETVNPFKFLQCPWNETADFPPLFIIEVDAKDIEEVKELYPKKADELQPEEVATARRYLDKLLLSVVEGVESIPGKQENSVVLKRMFVKPNTEFPNGRILIWANGVLLDEGDLDDGFFPFSTFDWMYVPGRQYPLSMVTPLKPLQKELNITLSQLIELKNRQLRGDMVVEGLQKPRMEIDPVTGRKTIFVPYGTKWELMKYDLNIAEANDILNRCWNDMMQIAGIHESALGAHPPRASTATQVQLLKESDLAGLASFRKNMDFFLCSIARHKLILAQNRYKNERILKSIGTNNEIYSRSFFGSDLKGLTDVRPRTTPLLPSSAIAQLKLEAASRGLYGPYQSDEDELSKRIALQAMQIPGVEQEMRDFRPIHELRKRVAYIRNLKSEIEIANYTMQLTQMQNAIMQAQAMMANQGLPNMQASNSAMQVPGAATTQADILNQSPTGGAGGNLSPELLAQIALMSGGAEQAPQEGGNDIPLQ